MAEEENRYEEHMAELEGLQIIFNEEMVITEEEPYRIEV